MTAEELIAELQKCPPAATVLINTSGSYLPHFKGAHDYERNNYIPRCVEVCEAYGGTYSGDRNNLYFMYPTVWIFAPDESPLKVPDKRIAKLAKRKRVAMPDPIGLMKAPNEE